MNANTLLQAQQKIDAGVQGYIQLLHKYAPRTPADNCVHASHGFTHWQCALQVVDTRLLSKKQKGLVQLHKREMKLKAVGRK